MARPPKYQSIMPGEPPCYEVELLSADAWRKGMGASRSQMYRWIKEHGIDTRYIGTRLFLVRSSIKDFNKRVLRGELGRKPEVCVSRPAEVFA